MKGHKYSDRGPFVIRITLIMAAIYLLTVFITTWWITITEGRTWRIAAESLYEYYLLIAIVIIVLTALLISGISRLVEERFESEHRRRLIADATAHDMKTPLSIIRNYAELILYEASGENSSHYARTIIEESESMNNTVVNMLDLSKMEAGTYPMDLSDFNLSELMREDIERHKALIEEKKLQLRMEVPEDIFVFADHKLMSMAFSNYLSNGIRHAEEGTALTVSLEKIKNRVRISVHNVGQPVSDREMQKIWGSLYNTNNASGRNRGMGLTIVSKICLMQGGKCGCSNEMNGVRFWLEIGSQEGRLLKADVMTGPVLNVTGKRKPMEGVVSLAIGTIIQGFFGLYDAYSANYRISIIGDVMKEHCLTARSVEIYYEIADVICLAGMLTGSLILLKGISTLRREYPNAGRNMLIIGLTLFFIVFEGVFAILAIKGIIPFETVEIVISISCSLILYILTSLQLITNSILVSDISGEAGDWRRSCNLKRQLYIIVVIVALVPVLAISNIMMIIPWNVVGDTWFAVLLFSGVTWIRATKSR